MGCVNSYLLPGNSSSARSISSTSSALVLDGSGHSLCGFNVTKLSATLGGMGSVATSAVPIRAKSLSTSGNALILCSRISCISTACSRPVPGIRIACSAMSPSFNCGMNSEPRVVANHKQHATNTVAKPTTTQRNFRASLSSGWEADFALLMMMLSVSLILPFINTATAAGNTVNESTMADNKAITTVAAIG